MDETKTITPKIEKQEVKEPRRLRREKQQATNMFNKLLFEFIEFEAKESEVVKGFVIISGETYGLMYRLDEKWRIFCHHVGNNNKKQVEYKIDALENAINKHIEWHKDSEWAKCLVQVLKDEYGVNMPIKTAYSYLNRTNSPDYIADSINSNLRNMYQIEIPEINFTKEIPESIAEMSNDDFQFFAGMLHKVFEGDLEVYDLKTAMALKYLGVKYSPKDYNKLKEEGKEKVGENLNGLTELLDYFFVLKEGKLSFNTGFTKNFVPELSLGFGRKLYGPEAALTDISLHEYKDANSWYRSYLETQDEADLNMVIAILYRPHKLPFGIWKKKVSYKPAKAYKRARKIAKLPIAQRFAIHLFYMACEEFLRTGSANVDGNELDFKLLYETTLKEKQMEKPQKYKADTGLAGVALSIAGTGIFGPLKSVYKQNLYDVIVLLLKQRVEYLNNLENTK